MKFVVYGEQQKLGLLEGQRVMDLALAGAACREAFGRSDSEWDLPLSSLQRLIESGRRGLDLVGEVAERLRVTDQPGVWSNASEVQLHAPWPGQRFALVGSNNANHVATAFTNMGTPRTVEEVRDSTRKGVPSGFWGMARPVMGPDAQIQIPSRAKGLFDYEGEPAIVLGKQGKDIKAKDIADYIWGVTLIIDWSIREEAWPPKPYPPLMPVKNFDQSKSIGPCIVVDEIDPNDFHIETYVNGQRRQSFDTSEMVFSFGEVLEHFSRDFTFFPGDIIAGGTGAGTAIDQTVPNADGSWPRDLFLKPGDKVEVRAEGIGSIFGQIVA